MQRLTENKIILIIRRTRVEEIVARFNTISQARFYVEHLGADFSDYQAEDACYRHAVSETEKILGSLGRVHKINREFLPNFIFGKDDIVVALGQDGLVANTLKYLSAQKLIGVNPDPSRWDGVLLPFQVRDLTRIVPEVFAGKRQCREITMAKAKLNTGQTLYAVNDLFFGPKSHTSARYIIRIGKTQEQHSSSGLIVSTGLGSTGWFKSLIAGAMGITRSLSGAKKTQNKAPESFPWDADYLYYTVREPFVSKTSSAGLVFGKISAEQPLRLISQMPESGVIFSDGIESDFLEFNSGTEAVVTIAEKKGYLVS